MVERDGSTGSPGEERTRGREDSTGRGLKALLLAAGLGGVAAAIAFSAFRQPEQDPQRFVATSSPRQVTGPDRAPRQPTGTVEVGAEAPALALHDLTGRMRSLHEHRGRPVILNIWASWCPPCIAEMPSLERLHRSSGGRFDVVSVSVDDDLVQARRIVERLGITFPVLLDPGGTRAATWGTVKFPETWIVDAEGRVVNRIIGGLEWDAPGVLDGVLPSR